MSPAALDLEDAVLKLSEKDRAELARILLLSLDSAEDDASEVLWAEEAERRYAELESGAVQAIPSEQVFLQARARRK